MKRHIKVTPLGYLGQCCVCERSDTVAVQIEERNVYRLLAVCQSCAGHIARWWNKVQMAKPKRKRTTQARPDKRSTDR